MIEAIITQTKDFLMSHRDLALIVNFLTKHGNFIIGIIINLILISALCKLTDAFNKKIEKILLNGTLAYNLFVDNFGVNMHIPYIKMPSTSLANPRFNAEIWRKELNDVFRIY